MTWFALYAIAPLKAERELLEASFTVYVPTEPRKYRQGHQERVTQAPLLGAYVLAQIPEDRFHDALACEHVAYCVGSGGSPRPIPGPVVDDLRDMVAALQREREEEAARKAAEKAAKALIVVSPPQPKQNHKRPKQRKRKRLIGLASLMVLLERQTQHLAQQAEP